MTSCGRNSASAPPTNNAIAAISSRMAPTTYSAIISMACQAFSMTTAVPYATISLMV